MTPTEADERAYPPLPEPSLTSYSTDSIMRRYEHRSYTADQLREYLDADRTARSPATGEGSGEAEDVLRRNGFVRCDIPACNCGSWHARYGLPERMAEIKEALSDAGHPLCNENFHLVSKALAALIDERDSLRAAPAPSTGPIIGYATHHEPPMFWHTLEEAQLYCDDDDEPIPLVRAGTVPVTELTPEEIARAISAALKEKAGGGV